MAFALANQLTYYTFRHDGYAPYAYRIADKRRVGRIRGSRC